MNPTSKRNSIRNDHVEIRKLKSFTNDYGEYLGF